jgi:hypothetical protein
MWSVFAFLHGHYSPSGVEASRSKNLKRRPPLPVYVVAREAVAVALATRSLSLKGKHSLFASSCVRAEVGGHTIDSLAQVCSVVGTRTFRTKSYCGHAAVPLLVTAALSQPKEDDAFVVTLPKRKVTRHTLINDQLLQCVYFALVHIHV